MKGLQRNRTLFLASIFVAMIAIFAAMAPAYASAPVQATLPAPTLVGPTAAVTNVVPNTGANSAAAFPGWALMAVLGLIIVVLLVALLARGSNRSIE